MYTANTQQQLKETLRKLYQPEINRGKLQHNVDFHVWYLNILWRHSEATLSWRVKTSVSLWLIQNKRNRDWERWAGSMPSLTSVVWNKCRILFIVSSTIISINEDNSYRKTHYNLSISHGQKVPQGWVSGLLLPACFVAFFYRKLNGKEKSILQLFPFFPVPF